MKTNQKHKGLLFETNTNNFGKVSKQDQDYIINNFLPKHGEIRKFKEYYSGLNPKLINPLAEKHLTKRSYSTHAGGDKSSVKFYKNASLDKKRIISENKGKSGVYRWTNLISGKSYIGSALDLARRFRVYYSLPGVKKILSRYNSRILSAIVKYGYSNFTL